MNNKARYSLAAARIGLGWIVLWAFIDKLFGLGFATARENAWLAGGSPTFGFLNFASTGPFAGLYQNLAGSPVIDVLFMSGLLGLGIALILGIGMRIAGVAGPLLMLLLWSARLPTENNPLIDEHIIYAFLLIALSAADVGKTWGLGRWWSEHVGKVAPVLV